jgi:N-acetylglucosamine kinase-like BadF-type ATPase
MTRFFLGVDTGATKSHALIADDYGRAIGFGQGGPGNWETVGWEGARATLEAIISAATAAAGIDRRQISAAGFGLAGYDWPEDLPPHLEVIHSLGIDAPLELMNDAILGLLAGSSNGWGIAVSAGTSCNCYGRDEKGNLGRVGGASHLYGEYAGASELVNRAIHAIARAWSRRGPATQLTDVFISAAEANSAVDLLGGLMRGRYHIGAAHAPLIFKTAAAGDHVAGALITWAGHELGDLALGVIRQLSLEKLAFEVVLSGSFFDGSPLVQECMSETIRTVAPLARLRRLQAPPVVGGVLLGMEQVRLSIDRVRPRLIEAASQLIHEA